VIFTPSANLAVATSIVMLVAFALSGLVGWWPRTELARHLHWPVGQPVPFSHDHHVAGLGLDCRFCHSSVEVSAQAGMPPTHTCMTCHSQIWTNAQVLAPVRESFADHTPIAWNRVSDLPDYVYFDHSIHIVKGGGCQDCHGPIAHMPLTYNAESLTMRFCLDCHRNPGPQLRPSAQIYNTLWRRAEDMPAAEVLMRT
jgi:Cytochrome c7 and related cytochrome c